MKWVYFLLSLNDNHASFKRKPSITDNFCLECIFYWDFIKWRKIKFFASISVFLWYETIPNILH